MASWLQAVREKCMGLINDTAESVSDFLRESDHAGYIRCVTHTKPNLRILVVETGFGEQTRSLLKTLTRNYGQPMYAQYVIADKLPDRLGVISQAFKSFPSTGLYCS
jgi:hypothetical protein